MFTGIIQALGTIAAVGQQAGDTRIRVRGADLPWHDYAVGDSIAVSGVCLTAAELHPDGFAADVSRETLDVTTLGALKPGDRVNLEPALAVGDRLGGHLVSGHVDCVGTITRLRQDARSLRMLVEIPDEYARFVVRKGSVCVDGVSLTINEVSGNRFELNIIPHTAEMTTLGTFVTGQLVNIEVDQLARYLERLLGKDDNDLTIDFLRAHGYAK